MDREQRGDFEKNNFREETVISQKQIFGAQKSSRWRNGAGKSDAKPWSGWLHALLAYAFLQTARHEDITTVTKAAVA